MNKKIFLIARPTAQAGKLIDLIEKSGNEALLLPVIAIKPLADTLAVNTIAHMDNYAIAIFISANAVHVSAPLIKKHAKNPRLNEYLQIAAIGAATATALSAYGWQANIIPEKVFSSEGLLSHERLQDINGLKIIIFKGKGGRQILATKLGQRGAEVTSAVTYERGLPDIDVSATQKLLEYARINSILVMSNESLHNLVLLIGTSYRQYLLKCRLVVISNRTADFARRLGFVDIATVADKPDDLAIFKAINNVT